MKNLYTLLAFILLTGLNSFGQGTVDYQTRSKFYLGFNFGGTYHSNTEVDVNRLYRGGAGFTFGYSFGMKPGNLLSVDLQARYLLAAYRGASDSKYTLNSNTNDILNLNEPALQPVLDYENAYGYYVPNFHTWVNDWSLELKLNTNRLRERTGWNFFVLGGVGTTKYGTRIDFYDNTSAGQVKLEDDLFETKQSIISYETPIVKKRDWMPSLGAGIERQITPNAAFQLMGRMTWTRNNDFDGLANSFSGQASNSNDRYHYASAGIKVYLRGRTNNYVNEDDDPIVRPNPNPPVQGRMPVARFTTPNSSPITVSFSSYGVVALVQNVAGKQNITLTQNGQAVNNYSYNANTDKLNFNSQLVPGQNTFNITAVNNFGQAQDQTIIIYNPQVNTVNPPIVTITNPNSNAVTVQNSIYNFASTVLNVDGKQNISVFVNGNNQANFSYNTINNAVTLAINLIQGKNVVTITGTNSVGTDSETAEIIYRKPITAGPPPIVTILTPSANPFQTTLNSANVEATISNVSNKNNISVLINGASTNNFNFNINSGQINFVTNLIQGNNVVEVKAVNQFGQDAASTLIIYQPVQNVQLPVVAITSPANMSVYSVPIASIQGSALHVDSQSNVTVLINGQSTNNFSFNTGSKLVVFNAPLINGNNSIQIIGTNGDGQDQAQINVVYNKPIIKTPPVVNIIDPSVNNKTYSVSAITAKATVLNVSNKSNITVKVNGISTNNFSFNANSNLVTVPLNLNSGANILSVFAANNDGTDSDQKTILYKKVVTLNPPTVNFVNPNTSPVTVSTSNYIVTAATTNISSKSQIVLKQNGTVVNGNSYSFSGSTISFASALVTGNNIFEVSVTNTAGTDSKTTSIIYKKVVVPCTKPTIGYVAPAPNSTVSTAAQVIEAQVNNHIAGTVVNLKLNGASVGSMAFNSITQIAKKSVTLNQGTNTLEVTVSNSCGTNKSTFILYYKNTTPCNAPVVTLKSVAGTVSSSSYNLSGTVSNITSTNQVKLLLNGVAKPVNLTNGNISANLILKSGINNIVVTGTNACGNDAKTIVVNYTPCLKPLVKMTSGASTVSSSTYLLSANVTNTTNKNQVTVKLNGISVPFSLVANKLTANLNLKIGNNAIVVSVQNLCGKDSKSATVNYSPCQPVKLSMVKPSSSSVSTKTSTYQIVAKFSGDLQKQGTSVKLNGNSIPFNFNTTLNTITVNASGLVNGINSVLITANGTCGKDVLNYKITANTCVPPTVNVLASGSQKITTVKSLNYSYSAIVSGMTSKTGITLKLNGRSVSFNYSVNTGKLSAQLTLKEGTNTIVLSAANTCGNASKAITVNANTCVTPKLTAITPRITTTTDKSSQLLTVAAVGVNSVNEVTVKLNGVNIKKSLNRGKISVSATNLKIGLNTVVVSVTNRCGTSSVTYRITRKTCAKPVIKQLSNATKVTVLTFPYLATVTGVPSKASISLKVNSKAVPFTYNTKTGRVSATLSLVEGKNTVLLTSNNNCGNSTKSHTITATTCKTPEIKVGYPTNTSITTANTTFSLIAIGINVSQSDIKVTNNGATIPFSFNSTTGKITVAVANMSSGINRIKIKGSNACGNSQIEYVITYTGTSNKRSGGGSSPQKRN